MKKKRSIVLVLASLLVGAAWLFAADNDVTMSQVDGTDNKFVTIAPVTNGFIGFDGSDNLVAKSAAASQTPWAADIDADGFDLRDVSNIEYRVTTGAPAGTVPGHWFDAGGINFNVPTADLFDFLVNGVSQVTIDVATVDLQGNILTDVLDITSITSLNGIAIANYILSTDNLGALAATTSAQFLGVISDGTGTGLVPFATNPTFTSLTATGTMDLSGGTFDVTLNAAVDGLNFDSDTLSIDASNDRIGIGLVDPQNSLEVAGGAILASSPTLNGGTNFERLSLSMADGGEATIAIQAGGSGAAGDLFLNMARVGIGTSVPDGRLHVFEGSAGGVTANSSADDFVVENSTSGGISLLVPNASLVRYALGSTSDNIGAQFLWDHNNGTGLARLGSANPGADLVLETDLSVEQLRILDTGEVILQHAISGVDDASTLGVAATTFVVTSNFATITGDGGGNTIATITGGLVGQQLILLFVDALVTITDDNTHAADSIDLSAAFTSADDTTLSLIHNGTSWYEASRSVN